MDSSLNKSQVVPLIPFPSTVTFHLKTFSWLTAPSYSHHHPGSQLSLCSTTSNWSQVLASLPLKSTTPSPPCCHYCLDFCSFLFSSQTVRPPSGPPSSSPKSTLSKIYPWTQHSPALKIPRVSSLPAIRFDCWDGPSSGSFHSLETGTPSFGHKGHNN